MILTPITYGGHAALPFVQQLYEASFPAHERRVWKHLLKLLDESGMQLSVIQNEGAPIGLLIGWQLDDWYYIEHLAIDLQHRGKQYGGIIMQDLIERSKGRIILETELPHDEQAVRRIRFYERLGFIAIPFTYYQPPYREGESATPMQLMSIPVVTDKTVFDRLAANIKENIYTRFY